MSLPQGGGRIAKPSVFIWGMGLIGASLGLRLREIGYEISGAVRSEQSREALAKLGFSRVFVTENDSIAALRNCDLLVLGLNLADCLPVLDRVFSDPLLCQKLLVFDLCSSKRAICDFVASKYPDARFIGCHPMAGKETQGPGAAEANLFEGSTVFLTPLASQTGAVQREIREQTEHLWRQTGAKTQVIDSDAHDSTMAYVSHGLHLAACLIARLSADVPSANLAVTPAAGSYRDMTRIAQSSGAMWQDIAASNHTHIAAWLRRLGEECSDLAASLEKGEADIAGLFADAQTARKKIMRT